MKKLKILVVLLSLPFFGMLVIKTGTVTAQTQAPAAIASSQAETAGQKFKNIKVLNDMPAEQLGKVMNMMSASLGVNCNFCHIVDQWEKDDKKEKSTARDMIRMTFGINKASFEGRTEVSCNTCHNGREHPQGQPNLMPAPQEERPAQPAVKPTTDQILDKYVTAVGGTANIAKVTSRSIKANRVESDGKRTEPEVIMYKGGKYTLATTYPQAVVSEGYDGNDAWKRGPKGAIALKADEVEQIKREAQLFDPANLKTIYTKIDYRFTDRIDGREVNVLTATTASGVRERLAFDVQTGLLVRRSSSSPTVLGAFVYQVDYSDYKDFGGLKVPTTIKYSMPNVRWTRVISDVKNNADVQDSAFARPQ
jgi:photosynthetic reaction center cytochrome c subunit